MDEPSHSSKAATWGAGQTAEELLPKVYEELRRLAALKLAREHPGQTLQPTALVHEAWLRLSGSAGQHWESCPHFLGAAAEAMRRILVDKARHKQRLKWGGACERVEFNQLELCAPMADEELLELDEALTQLAEVDSEAARLVNLRFFAGLTQVEAAQQMGISRSTADRTWAFARAWLYDRLHSGGSLEAPRYSNTPDL